MPVDRDKFESLSALNDEIAVELADHRDDCSWVLTDATTGEEVPVWPSEVDEMVALLNAFKQQMTTEGVVAE